MTQCDDNSTGKGCDIDDLSGLALNIGQGITEHQAAFSIRIQISMVLPDIEVTTSPGFVAQPLGIFSAAATTPITLIFGQAQRRLA